MAQGHAPRSVSRREDPERDLVVPSGRVSGQSLDGTARALPRLRPVLPAASACFAGRKENGSSACEAFWPQSAVVERRGCGDPRRSESRVLAAFTPGSQPVFRCPPTAIRLRRRACLDTPIQSPQHGVRVLCRGPDCGFWPECGHKCCKVRNKVHETAGSPGKSKAMKVFEYFAGLWSVACSRAKESALACTTMT